jgi:hypothetical protein
MRKWHALVWVCRWRNVGSRAGTASARCVSAEGGSLSSCFGWRTHKHLTVYLTPSCSSCEILSNSCWKTRSVRPHCRQKEGRQHAQGQQAAS